MSRQSKHSSWLGRAEWVFPLRGRWRRYLLLLLGSAGLLWLWMTLPNPRNVDPFPLDPAALGSWHGPGKPYQFQNL